MVHRADQGNLHCPTRQDAKSVLHVYQDKSMRIGPLDPRDRALECHLAPDHVPVSGRPR
jgi:hypothetical protein